MFMAYKAIYKFLKTLICFCNFKCLKVNVAAMSTEYAIDSLKRPLNDAEEVVPTKLANLDNTRIKKKKYALLLSYSGLGYLGLQRNPGMKTIEEDLLLALLKGGIINEETYKLPQNIQFQRAARTDKGVSAVRQVLSLKLPEEVDLDIVNSNLPEQIRVFAVKRATKNFNCKGNCDARTYSYMMPSYALAPEEETVSENYRITQAIIDRTNEVLLNFLGTHNYHNFTSKKKPMDPSAMRYIISFTCGDPVISDDVEYITLKVKGQSFMLHQIRKMTGLVIAIVRGITTVDTFKKAWEKAKVDLPVAPGLGLVLEEAHYDRYNQRYGSDGIHEPIEWSSVEKELDEFKKKYILSTIVKTEKEEKSMLAWLETLPKHSFQEQSGDSAVNELNGDDEDSVSNGNDEEKSV